MKSFFKVLSLGVLIFCTGYTASIASGPTPTIVRGEGRTINWAVGNYPTCVPSTNFSGEPLYTSWMSGQAGSGTYAATSSKYLIPFNVVGSFDFTCSGGGASATSSIIVIDCPTGTIWNAGINVCEHPAPVVSITPGDQTISVGESMTYTSVATDANSDMISHELEWQKPDGTWSWTAPAHGTVSYTGATAFAGAPKGSNTLVATFTPDQVGAYNVRFAVKDDTLNTQPGYFTPGGRLTYSAVHRLTVTNLPDGRITSCAGGNICFQCFNSDTATLIKTVSGVATAIFTDIGLPPSSWTYPNDPSASYALSCKQNNGKVVTKNFYDPVLTKNGATATAIDLGFDCVNPAAQSATLQRTPGGAPVSYGIAAIPSISQTGLTKQTDYLFTLRCYDGPLVSGSVSGSQIGNTTLTIRTTNSIVDPNPVVVDAYIRGVIGDPTNQPSASTADGTFYDWQYTITSGIATSCTMQQQNDNTGWYPVPGYATNVSTYNFAFSSLSNSQKLAFISQFNSRHDWKISCVDGLGTITEKIWSITKQVLPHPELNNAITKPTSGPQIADVPFICVPSASTYTIKNSSGITVMSGAYTGRVVFTPSTPDNYRIRCDNGSDLIVLISANMWDPTFNLTGSSNTVGDGTETTLNWNISNPDASCTILAIVAIPASCDATCLADRSAASTTLNNFLQSGTTDRSDPYWPNGTRSITDALTSPGFNTSNARGRITVKNIKYPTTFVGQCNGVTPSQIKVKTSTLNEG
jgi:hypothetical protein